MPDIRISITACDGPPRQSLETTPHYTVIKES
jgi:hypothetical protein